MLYLASQSPRRRELLQQINVHFSILEVQVIEQRQINESPTQYVQRVARDKARAGMALLSESDRASAIVLGADTEVVLDGHVFGKPSDAVDAAIMLQRLSGCTHEVMSAICLTGRGRELSDLCLSQVRFVSLDDATIASYVASGEPFGKAGAYAIQGRGASLIEHLAGSYSGVMGLPLFETTRLLKSFDLFALE